MNNQNLFRLWAWLFLVDWMSLFLILFPTFTESTLTEILPQYLGSVQKEPISLPKFSSTEFFAPNPMHSQIKRTEAVELYPKSTQLKFSGKTDDHTEAFQNTYNDLENNEKCSEELIDSSNPNKIKIVYVYTLEKCEGLENVETGSTSENVSKTETARPKSNKSTQEVMQRESRNIALAELDRRYTEKLNDLLSSSNSRIRKLQNKSNPCAARRLKYKTRYLSTLQMELAEFPEFIKEEDALKLSEKLPCVKMAIQDYTIKTPEKFFQPVQSEEASLTSQMTNFLSKPFNSLYVKRSNGLSGEESQMLKDPLYSEQWYLDSLSGGIHFDSVFPEYYLKTAEAQTIVAIIDDGCDLNHEDLKNRLWTNPNEICDDGIDNDGNGYIDDCHGWDWVNDDNIPEAELNHGTAVAGIIAAETNNNRGITGICWNCKIMCLKYIGVKGGTVSNEVAALDYAIKMGARISNNSFGAYKSSTLEMEAIRRSSLHGHLVVASSGNDNLSTDDTHHQHSPSSYNLDNILAVGASTQHKKKATFSNYGKISVDLFAPGINMLTLGLDNQYKRVSGTSFATAATTGVVALIWSFFSSLTYLELIDILLVTCTPSSDLGDLARCNGIINLESALHQANLVQGNKLTNPEYKYIPLSRQMKNDATAVQSTGLVESFLSGFLRSFSF